MAAWQVCLGVAFYCVASTVAMSTRRERLDGAIARVSQSMRLAGGHLTKVLQLPLAPASVSLAPMPNDMIPGTIIHIRRAKRSHDENNKSPHAPLFLCQCAASARRRRERCRAEALTQGDARIEKRTKRRARKQPLVSRSPSHLGQPARDYGARAHQEALRLGLGAHNSTATMVKRRKKEAPARPLQQNG